MRKQRELFRVHGPTGKAPKGGGIPPVPPLFWRVRLPDVIIKGKEIQYECSLNTRKTIVH